MTAEPKPRVAAPDEEGGLADRYILGRVLGTGATAEVHSGWDRRLDRPVAIKLLRPGLACDPVVRRRFAEEARAAARLSHPNVVAVFDTGEPDGDGPPYIVMERLPGDTLRSALEEGPLPVAAVSALAAQMLSALRAGAAAGLVHCDIKPGNILAAGDGSWKLGDFGIARSAGIAAGDDTLGVGGGPEDTVTGLVMGTPAYLSPERLCGWAATEAADVFSLGVVLYEALTGRRPYRTTDSFPWSTALSGRPAEPVRSVRPEVPPALAAAVDRAVCLHPAGRFSSAEQMASALDAHPRAGRSARLIARARRHRGPATRRALTGAALAAALTASLLLLTIGTSAPSTPAGTAETPATRPAAGAAPATSTTLGPVTAAPAPVSPATVNVSSTRPPVGSTSAAKERPDHGRAVHHSREASGGRKSVRPEHAGAGIGQG